MNQHQYNGNGSPNGAHNMQLPSRIAAFISSQQPVHHPVRRRPRIGILSSSGCMRDGGWPVYAGDAATVNAIFEAGGYPVILPTLPIMQGYDPFSILTDEDAFDEVFRVVWPMTRNLDGLLLAGGGDLYSCLYGQAVHPQTGTPELWRDVWERYFALVAWVLCIPTLGICRGMQTMNAVRGGGLYQDARAQWPKNMPPLVPHRAKGRISADNWVEHPIIVHPKSKLAGIIRGREERVPYRQHIDAVLSMHHQIIGYLTPEGEVVGYLAPGLAVGAIAPDGVIEAIEDTEAHRFWVAVQFHPEWVVYLSWALRIFTSLVDASCAYATLPQNVTDPLRDEIRDWVRLCDARLTHQHLGMPLTTTRTLTPGPNTDHLIPFSIEESIG
jgi:gamma-glutamyl-gamma-aminobutyrate hydrolase PuuD